MIGPVVPDCSVHGKWSYSRNSVCCDSESEFAEFSGPRMFCLVYTEVDYLPSPLAVGLGGTEMMQSQSVSARCNSTPASVSADPKSTGLSVSNLR